MEEMEETHDGQAKPEWYCVINRIGAVLYHGTNLETCVERWVRGTCYGKGPTAAEALDRAKQTMFDMETQRIADEHKARLRRASKSR